MTAPTKKELKRAARDRERFWEDARLSLHKSLNLTLDDHRAELEALLVNRWRLVVHIEALPPEDYVPDAPAPQPAPLILTPGGADAGP